MAVGIPPNPSRACLRTRPAAQFTPVDRASDRPSQQRLLAQEVSLTAQRDGMLRELDQTRARVESMAQGLTLIEADAKRVSKIADRGCQQEKRLLTPEGSTLEAELYVPSRSAGFITPGKRCS